MIQNYKRHSPNCKVFLQIYKKTIKISSNFPFRHNSSFVDTAQALKILPNSAYEFYDISSIHSIHNKQHRIKVPEISQSNTLIYNTLYIHYNLGSIYLFCPIPFSNKTTCDLADEHNPYTSTSINEACQVL